MGRVFDKFIISDKQVGSLTPPPSPWNVCPTRKNVIKMNINNFFALSIDHNPIQCCDVH